jgi:RNA polymerase sigma-32 factor
MGPAVPVFNLSLLFRVTQRDTDLTPFQTQIDGVTGSFAEQAADWKSLAAMMAGNLASRLIKIGGLALGTQYLSKTPLFVRYGSSLIALAGESAAFTGMNRALHPGAGLPSSFGKEWLSSTLSLGALKFFGKGSEGQNGVFRHLLADGGLVVGHQLAFLAKVEEKPEGNLLTQFVKAEAMNWQMKGSAALLDGVVPPLHALERTFDLFERTREKHLHSESGEGFRGFLQEQEWAIIGPPRMKELWNSNVLKMSSSKEPEKGFSGGEEPQLDEATERSLIELIHQSQWTDKKAIDRFIRPNLGWVEAVARKYSVDPNDRNDLIQEGKLGLMMALERYDPHKGARFKTYAAYWVRAYMLQFIISNFGQIKSSSVEDRKLFWRFSRTKNQLTNRLGRDPTLEELAQAFQVSEEQVQMMEQRRSHSQELKLDSMTPYFQEKALQKASQEVGPSVDEDVSSRERRRTLEIQLEEFSKTLKSKKDQAVFKCCLLPLLYDEQPSTLQAIGKRHHISREAVRQRRERIKRRLIEFLEEKGLGYASFFGSGEDDK